MDNDIEKIKAQVSIVDVVSRYVHLRKNGKEHIGLCPFHDDHRPSMKVYEHGQRFKCYACGEAGDAIDFLIKMGRSLKEAKEELLGDAAESAINPVQNAVDRRKVDWEQVCPVPVSAPNPDFWHYKWGNPSNYWRYKNAKGQLVGYVCRFDTAEGKQIVPLIYATDGHRKAWRWQGFAEPRPVYNLYDLTIRNEATVMVVEGEKTADAAARLFPFLACITWVGGANSVRKTDWSVLQGRKVVFWPDNDKAFTYPKSHFKAGQLMAFAEQPGNSAMIAIYEQVKDICATARFVKNHSKAPNKWDLADCVWTPEQAQDYCRRNLLTLQEFKNLIL